jgi:hypothetical protein
VIRSETPQNAATTTVTFTLAHAGLDGQRVAVVGDFNDWDPSATPMERQDGVHTATMVLAPGRYRFRYLAEGGQWFNDHAADDYADNDHGGQDSVLDLTRPAGTGEPDGRTPQARALDTTVAADLGGELDLALEQDQCTDRERPAGKEPGQSRAEQLAARSSTTSKRKVSR